MIFNSCKQIFEATSGYVAMKSCKGNFNEVLFVDPGEVACTVEPSLPMPIRGMREQVYSSGKVVFSNNFSNSQWVSNLPKGHLTLKNVLFAPLIVKGQTEGLLGIANKPVVLMKKMPF